MSPFLNRFLHRALAWSGPLLLLFFAAYRCVDWGTERWWFQSLGYGAQFDRLFWWRAICFVVGGSVFAVWLGVNAHLAWRNASRVSVPLTFFESDDGNRLIPLEDKLQFDVYRRRATFIIVATLSWLAGLNCDSRYALFLRALNASSTGTTDKASGFDLGFFLFQLPFLSWLSHFCFYAIMSSLVVVVTIYLYEELIGPAARAPRIHAAFAKHLAVLWVILLGWKGLDCLLAVPASYVSAGNVATHVFDSLDMSLGWTSSGLFALSTPFFALISGLAIARHPRVQTFLIGMGWMLGASAIPILLPLMMGRSIKDRAWQEALKRHITSTRLAWGLDRVERQKIHLAPNAEFLPGEGPGVATAGLPVALWPPISAREVMNAHVDESDENLLVQRTWLEKQENSLVYTGVALPAPPDSQLDWRSRHFRSTSAKFLQLDASRTEYDGSPIFSPDTSVPVLFGPQDMQMPSNRRNEVGTVVGPEPANTPRDGARWVLASSKDGASGVALTSWRVRLGLAARFFDPGFASSKLQASDVASWHRGAADRCSQLAPFLDWQDEARPILVSDSPDSTRLVWLVSGMVWSDDYPDSAAYAAPGTSPEGANYGREVAVGVVDARTGKVTLFSLDEDEPFMALYRRVFPGLFEPLTSLPNSIHEQLRPSPAMLSAQTLIWARYHEDDLEKWVGRKSDWRPMFSPFDSEDTTLRAFAGPGSGDWLGMAYSTPGGSAGSDGSASPLNSILGIDQSDFASRGGKVKFIDWEADNLPNLPNTAAEPSHPYQNANSDFDRVFITVAPRFDAAGSAKGLFISRGQANYIAEKPAPMETSTPVMNAVTLPTAIPLPPRANKMLLDGKIELAGSGGNISHAIDKPLNQSNKALERARSAWADLLAARKLGDWEGVEKAEKQLGSALGTP